jgi:hypothetical protein
MYTNSSSSNSQSELVSSFFLSKSWLRSSCTVIFHWRTQSINWSGGERQQEQGRREREKVLGMGTISNVIQCVI